MSKPFVRPPIDLEVETKDTKKQQQRAGRKSRERPIIAGAKIERYLKEESSRNVWCLVVPRAALLAQRGV